MFPPQVVNNELDSHRSTLYYLVVYNTVRKITVTRLPGMQAVSRWKTYLQGLGFLFSPYRYLAKGMPPVEVYVMISRFYHFELYANFTSI